MPDIYYGIPQKTWNDYNCPSNKLYCKECQAYIPNEAFYTAGKRRSNKQIRYRGLCFKCYKKKLWEDIKNDPKKLEKHRARNRRYRKRTYWEEKEKGPQKRREYKKRHDPDKIDKKEEEMIKWKLKRMGLR